jgi:hypothetical protein
MTPTHFRECLTLLDWTQRGLARQLGYAEGTRMPNKKLGVDHAFDAFGYLCLGKFNLAKGESGTVTTHRVY